MFGLLGYGLLLVGIVYFDKRRDLKTGGRWGGSGRGQRQQRTACSRWGRATLDALQDLEDGGSTNDKDEETKDNWANREVVLLLLASSGDVSSARNVVLVALAATAHSRRLHGGRHP